MIPAVTPERYARLTRYALWALAVIVVSGAAVRLTGSGLGCSDWPTCEEDQFVARLEYHALIEFVNRLFTGVVGVTVILAVLGSHRRVPRRRELTWWSWGLVAGVIAQIVLGALLVKSELDPRFTMGHFLLSVVLLWNAVVLDEKALGRDDEEPVADTALLTALGAIFIVGATLLVTGTLVTGAGPHAGDTRAERLPLLVRDVTRIHSLIAIALLLLVLFTWYRVRDTSPRPAADSDPDTPRATPDSPHRTPDNPPRTPDNTARRLLWIAALLFVQGSLGYTQYFAGVPVLLVGVHVALATITWIELVRVTYPLGRTINVRHRTLRPSQVSVRS